jgi:hypothetical protein
LEQIAVVFGSTGVAVGDSVDLLVYEDTDGDADPSDATLLATYSETVQVADMASWSTYTLTSPLTLNGPGDVLIGVINRYQPGTGGGLIDYPAAEDQTSSQYRSWAGWWTTEPAPDPAVLPPDSMWGIIDDLAPTLAGNWMIRGTGSQVTTNTAPTISGLPDQTLPVNGSANDAIDLWAYANDVEDTDDVMTYTIANSPVVSAGVTIDSNRYIDINPATDWSGTTDVEIQVQDTGGLTDTDTFQVTVSDDPDIEVSPASLEETLDVDEVFTATLTISNTGGASLMFLIDDGGAAWLSEDPGSGTVAAGGSELVDVVFDATGLTAGNDYSTDLTIVTNDPDENPVTVPVTMHVSSTANTAPTIAGLPNQSLPVNGSADNAIDLWAYASDVEDADADLTLSIVNSPVVSAGVSIDSNRYIDINPATDWSGTTDVEVQVQDTGGLTDTDTFQVTVSDDPDIEVSPASFEETLEVDEVFTATLTISNTGGASLMFLIDDGGAAWLSEDPDSGTVAAGGSESVDVVFDATGQSLGDYTTDLTIVNNDPDENPVTVSVTMHVSSTANTAPTIAGLPDQQVPVNGSADNAINLWTYADDAEDADADLTFSIVNSPDVNAGVTLDSNQYIDISPATDWSGITDVQIQVQDTGGLTDTDTFQVTVTETGTITDVTVSVSGNQLCAGRTTGVERCFDIAPAAALEATVRFYLTEAERNGLTLDDLLVFHYSGGSWTEEPGPYSSGGTGDAQYVEAQNIDDFSPFALDEAEGGGMVYLPIVMKNHPPYPGTPTLNAISNSDNDGNYTVSWSAIDVADTYTLEEDDNTSFSSPTTRYSSSGTSWSASGQAAGTYYYRVKAINQWEGQQLESGWSNVRSVKVFPPTKFYPTADTTIIQGAASSSYGSATTMLAGYGHSGCLGWDAKVTRSLVKFDLSDIPQGTTISEAKLYLYLAGTCYYTGHSQPRTVTLYRNTADFSSSTTWNSRPSFSEAAGAASVSVTTGGYKAFNVTTAVRRWINGTRVNYGFTVRGPETSGSEFALLEFATLNASGTSYDPYLQITYPGMDASVEIPASEELLTPDAFGPTFIGAPGISSSASNCVLSEPFGLRTCTLDGP